MPDLLDKLNLLLRSNMNNLLNDSPSQSRWTKPPTPEELDAELSAPAGSTGDRPRIPMERLGKDIDREIAVLRQHIDQALADEDKMKDKLDQMGAQIDDFDRKADEALQQGDQDKARDYIRQMNVKKQLAEQERVELRRHGTATSELIERVNTLESIVSDARRQQQEQTSTPDTAAQAAANTISSAGGVLSTILKDARERVEAAINTPAAGEAPKQDVTPDSKPADSNSVNVPIKVMNDPNVEADLARRRARLSKPE